MNSHTHKSPSNWTDQDVEAEIALIQDAIQDWAGERSLWYDCGFKSHLEESQCEPSDYPVIMYMYSDRGIDSITIGEYETEFTDLLDELGYIYETQDNVSIALYTDDEERQKKFYEYFHWQWVCSLLVEDTGDVYEELFSHFAGRPDDLHKLPWRDFEILLFRIFQNHGYKALLGPGRGDGGVDLRLIQENPIGDILTVVQAKRYAPHRKIEAVPVQALYGVSKVEGANHALFITTSSYTPAAKTFAGRVPSEVQLAQKEDIITWCSKATGGVIRDKSTLIARETVERLVKVLAQNPDARIVHASYGYNVIYNSYAIVVKETKHAALLLRIGNLKVSHDGYGTRGTEAPLLDFTMMSGFNEEGVFRALRSESDKGRISYWDGNKLYTPWDRLPNDFDYMD